MAKTDPKKDPKKEAADVDTASTADDAVCGHKNRHYQGSAPMTCTLQPGHEGNHAAPYVRLLADGKTSEKAMASWGDDAGIPLEVLEVMAAEEVERNKPKAPSMTQRLTKADLERMRATDGG